MSYRPVFTRKELLVVGTILLILWGLVVILILNGPPSVVPLTPPEEKNRVFVQNFSMICPENWYTSNVVEINEIRSMSATDVSSSSYPLGTIRAMRAPYPYKEEDEIKCLPIMEFQGSTAYYENEVEPPRKMLGPSGYFFALYFEREGLFYRLSYFVNRKQKEFPPSIILEYFNTFRVENKNDCPQTDTP